MEEHEKLAEELRKANQNFYSQERALRRSLHNKEDSSTKNALEKITDEHLSTSFDLKRKKRKVEERLLAELPKASESRRDRILRYFYDHFVSLSGDTIVELFQLLHDPIHRSWNKDGKPVHNLKSRTKIAMGEETIQKAIDSIPVEAAE